LRGSRLTKAAGVAEVRVEEALSYYAFPEERWPRIRTNGPFVDAFLMTKIQLRAGGKVRGLA
jgi:hypothetical protein